MYYSTNTDYINTTKYKLLKLNTVTALLTHNLMLDWSWCCCLVQLNSQELSPHQDETCTQGEAEAYTA